VLPPSFSANPLAAQDNTPANNRITGASCHRQKHGFSDPERFGTGFAGGLTGRNPMGLVNE